MDDTTDKPSSPVDSTDDAKPTDAPLDDKDLGQEDDGTGTHQDDSESHDDAPSDDSEADTEEEAEEDETTSEDEGTEDEEDDSTLLTPEEIKNLPPQLKAQYVSMNKRFQGQMKVANDLVAKAREIILNGGKPADAGESSAAPSIVETVLQRRGIDPTKLRKDVRETLDLVAEVAQEAGGAKANEAVAPLQAREVKQQVDGYFTAHPERKALRNAMAELDRTTGETMTLDQLYYAVSGSKREKAEVSAKTEKLRTQARRNSESNAGTPGGNKEEGDIFDEIGKAGGHDNSILL